jgi:lysophospholipase L1-like esterase
VRLSRREALFAAILVLFVVGSVELTLRLLALVSPRVAGLLASPEAARGGPRTVRDARLGRRPSPDYPGHDRKGFRNLEVPATADIVALGDSQTYGAGVDAADVWPRRLASLTGHTVYSMAYGGYGPTHSLALWDEAVALSPKVIIEAFYAGNDLADSFDHAYRRKMFPELKSADPGMQARVREAQRTEPIARRAARMFPMGTSRAGAAAAAPRGELSAPERLLSQSNIYGLLRRAVYEARRPRHDETPQQQWEAAKAFAAAHPAYCQVFSAGPFNTIFTSEYRLLALDLGDPRIAEGLQISLRAMLRMHEQAAAKAIRFFVVMIPTKEMVFRQLWADPTASYRILMDNEERAWRIAKDFLERHGIEHLDVLPALRGQLAAGLQPYKVNLDGHPNRHGHQAIAQLVAEHLRSTRSAR